MGRPIYRHFLGTIEMRKLATALVNAFGGLRDRAVPLVTGKKPKESRTQKDAAAWMRDGYRTYSTPGGNIYVTEESELAYFNPEKEFSPQVMHVKPAPLVDANSGPNRRTVRFIDPADEFQNAQPASGSRKVDYRIFTVKGVPEKPPIIEGAPQRPF